MKVQLFSDLHLEFDKYTPDVSQADVVVLAGDIWNGFRGIEWIENNIINKEVVYVLGNHELWKKAHPKLVKDIKDKTDKTNIHVLENNSVKIGGVNFLGATMWTDYDLFDDKHNSKLACWSMLNDFKKIRTSPQFSKFSPNDAMRLHEFSKLWLCEELERLHGQKNIVVTHHAPSVRSLSDIENEHILNAAYASNLEHIILKHKPSFWFHGHVHSSSDYMVDETRIVCNPRGNPYSRNQSFIDSLVFEV